MSDNQGVITGQLDVAGTYTLTSTTANAPSHAPAGDRHTAFTGALAARAGQIRSAHPRPDLRHRRPRPRGTQSPTPATPRRQRRRRPRPVPLPCSGAPHRATRFRCRLRATRCSPRGAGSIRVARAYRYQLDLHSSLFRNSHKLPRTGASTMVYISFDDYPVLAFFDLHLGNSRKMEARAARTPPE